MKNIISFFIIVFCFLILPSLSFAEGHGGGEAKSESKSKAKFDKEDLSTISGDKFNDNNDPVYLNLPPLIMPIINDDGAQQIVSILISLQVKDADSAKALKDKDPILKDALVTAMYDGLANGIMRSDNSLDISVIKNQIKKTVNKIFEGDHVKEVLIQAVSQRRF